MPASTPFSFSICSCLPIVRINFSMLALPLTRAAGSTVRRSLWIGQKDAVGKSQCRFQYGDSTSSGLRNTHRLQYEAPLIGAGSTPKAESAAAGKRVS